MKGFIGLDLGSTAVKGVAVSAEGELIGSVSNRVIFNPHEDPAVKEIDGDYYFDLIASMVGELAAPFTEEVSISWVSASGNLLFLDDDKQMITPIMSWLDTQPSRDGITLADTDIAAEDLYRIVGWPFSAQFPFGRLLWLKSHDPGLLNSSGYLCQHQEYLGYLLTGRFLIDHSTATTGYLAEQENRNYDHRFLETLEVAHKKHSPIMPVSTLLGTVTDEFRADTNLPIGSTAVLGSFDHPGAARALGIHREDQLMLSCGTSWVGFCILPDRETGLSRKMLIDPFESDHGGQWAGMFSLTSGGQYFDNWLGALYGGESLNREVFRLSDELAAEAYEQKETTPIMDLVNSDPDEILPALAVEFSTAEISLGLLESMVFAFIRRMQEIELSLDSINEIYLVGGPTNSSIWTQVIADILQKEIIVNFGQSAGAVGAAVIAARGVGRTLQPIDPGRRVITPDRSRYVVYHQKMEKFLDENSIQ